MAAGITQPGGAGTVIYIMDDASSSSGLGYTFAEISAAFPADFVALGTTPESYRGAVDVQIGDETQDDATTTLLDTNVHVTWDTGKTLLTRTTETYNWMIRLGTSVYSATTGYVGVNGCDLTFGAATTLYATCGFFGCKIVCMGGAFVISSQSLGDPTIEGFHSSTVEHRGTAATDAFLFADPLVSSLIVANRSVFIAATTTGPMFTSAAVASLGSGNIFIGNPTSFVKSADIAGYFTDPSFVGTPSVADIYVDTALDIAYGGWVFTRPRWTGNAPRFAFGYEPVAIDGAQEKWYFDVKVVDINGDPIAGIPVSLTDALTNLVIGQDTNAEGRLDPEGAWPVTVRDHYADSGLNYLTRDRSPFTLTVNSKSSPSYNSAYLTRTWVFDWPGLDDGNFSDVIMPVALQDQLQVGADTTWVEQEMP